MQMTVLVLDEANKVIYNRVRVPKRTYPFGNFMGAVIEVSMDGKRESVKVLPEPTYNKKNTLPYTVLRKTKDGYQTLILTEYYDVREVRSILFPVENATKYLTLQLSITSHQS